MNAIDDRIFELIAEHTSDLVCVHDSENTIRFATPSARVILGYAPEKLVGRKLTDFLAPEFISEMDFTTLRRFFDNPGTRIRYQVKHGNNRLRWLESTFTRIEKDQDKSKFSLLSSTRDITESVHLTDDLMSALASEQKFSQFKANLYSVASHEFKTPLAVMQAQIEMLRIKNDPKVLSRSLGSMEEEIDRLNQMIADMLELKKLTTGKVNLKPEPLEPAQLIEELIDKDCKKAYGDIAIDFDRENAPEREFVADYSLVRYIFSNLLINACKYSGSSKQIEVKLKYQPDTVRFEVRDYGIGIPDEDQAYIFNSFYRAKNVSNIHGTGVGLSIVKEFVDLHKGNIDFNSKPGAGSVFIVELPYSIAL